MAVREKSLQICVNTLPNGEVWRRRFDRVAASGLAIGLAASYHGSVIPYPKKRIQLCESTRAVLGLVDDLFDNPDMALRQFFDRDPAEVRGKEIAERVMYIFENKCFPDPAYQKKIETFLDFMHGDSPLAQLCYKFFELLSELSIQDWKFRVQNRVHEKAAIDNHLDIAGVYAVLFDCIFSDRLIPAGDKLTVEEVRAANPAAFKIGVLGQKIDDMWDMVEDVLLDAGRDILVANSFLVRISSSDREEILDKFRGGDQTSRQIRFSDLPANVRKQAMDFCAEISAEAKELAFIPRSGMNFSVRATRWRDFGVIQSPQLI